MDIFTEIIGDKISTATPGGLERLAAITNSPTIEDSTVSDYITTLTFSADVLIGWSYCDKCVNMRFRRDVQWQLPPDGEDYCIPFHPFESFQRWLEKLALYVAFQHVSRVCSSVRNARYKSLRMTSQILFQFQGALGEDCVSRENTNVVFDLCFLERTLIPKLVEQNHYGLDHLLTLDHHLQTGRS